MLHKLTSPFKLKRKYPTNTSSSSSSSSSSMAVGLGILVQASSQVHEADSKTVLKSTAFRLRLRLTQPMTPIPQEHPCYLKSCFLCHKSLNPDRDIYMYRGDLGFCSEECRSRQINLDDTKELELSTKKMVSAYRRCSGMSETGVLLDDLRRRNKLVPTQKPRAIFS